MGKMLKENLLSQYQSASIDWFGH